MLTQAFNEQVNYQAEAQAVLQEKAREQNIEAHQHTLKGHDFIIPKNAALGVADGGKLDYKKDEKFKKLFDHILRMQKLMDELDAGLGRIDGLINDIRDNDKIIKKGLKALKEDDIESMVVLLEEQGRYEEGMSDNEIREATKDLVGDKIDDQKILIAELERELKEFEQNVEGLDKNSPEYAKYKDQLNTRRDELRDIAEGNKKLNYEDAEQYLTKYNVDDFSVLREEYDSSKANIQSDDGLELTKDVDEVVEADSDISERVDHDNPFAEMEDVLSKEFNIAASGENALDVAMESTLDADLELTQTTQAVKPPTLS